jgi:DNA polymerase-4
VTLKLRYADFKTITRSRTFPHPTDDPRWIESAASKLLLEGTEAGANPVRLIGVSASGLVDQFEPMQLWLEFPGGLD